MTIFIMCVCTDMHICMGHIITQLNTSNTHQVGKHGLGVCLFVPRLQNAVNIATRLDTTVAVLWQVHRRWKEANFGCKKELIPLNARLFNSLSHHAVIPWIFHAAIAANKLRTCARQNYLTRKGCQARYPAGFDTIRFRSRSGYGICMKLLYYITTSTEYLSFSLKVYSN